MAPAGALALPRWRGERARRPGVPYNLLAAERGQAPFQLLATAILGAFPGLASLSVGQARAYLKTATVNGQPVWQTGP